MNKIPLYQHPLVNIFKLCQANQWQYSHKEGGITMDFFDKDIGKSIVKVEGANSSSNYLQVPASSMVQKHALGLTGRYAYLQMRQVPGKNFVIHLDYMVNETRHVRVSFSNIYKEFKNNNGNSLQIPTSLPGNKWHTIVFDVLHYFQSNDVFANGQTKFFLRSLQVCANVHIKGVYTSDILYTCMSLPQEMQFKMPKDKNWYGAYGWKAFPEELAQDIPEGQFEQEENKKQTGRSNNSKSQESTKKKAPQFKPKKEEIKMTQNQDLQEIIEDEKEEDENFDNSNQDREKAERTIDEIDKLKTQYKFNLESREPKSEAQVTLYKEFEPLPRQKNEPYIMKPNPIMRIERIVGMHPKFQGNKIFFNSDPKLLREILYCQANMIVGYYHSTQNQRIFYDEKLDCIEQFYVSKNTGVTYQNPRKGDDKEGLVTLWNFESAEVSFAFKPPMKNINSISISCDQSQLCLGGKDHQNRDLILIYNMEELNRKSHKKLEIASRHLSNFDIQNIEFSSIQPKLLTSVGKQNIQFWKLSKTNQLTSQPVIMNNTNRGKTFTRSVIEFNEKKVATQVFVSTTDGLLYVVNFATKQVEKVIQIHEAGIVALKLSINKQFLVSACENGVMRVWASDFSKLISEIKTESTILDIAICTNEKEVAVLSKEGQISLLDLENSTYNVIVRSHQDDITDIAHNGQVNRLVSISEDCSIKIWNDDSMDLLNEFNTQNDLPTCVRSHPIGPFAVVGCKSGFIRVFDLHKNEMLMETMIFEQAILDMTYSPNGKYLAVFFKSCQIVIFNAANNYQPIKTIDYEFPNSNYSSLCFSADSAMLANISSNANTVTIWECRNFTLKFELDLTGDLIRKVCFAPNGKDFILLTNSSKLKFYRVNASGLTFMKDTYGITDLETYDFEVSPNNQYIAVAGKDGVVKVFDYFMRGEVLPASQAFLGHLRSSNKILFSSDTSSLFSLGEGNGIFKWRFYGDRSMPENITKCFEKLETQKEKLEELTNQNNVADMSDRALLERAEWQEQNLLSMPGPDPLMGSDGLQMRPDLTYAQKPVTSATQSHHHINLNPYGYQLEQYDIELKKVLSLSTTGVKSNIVWNQEQRYIAYTSQNIVIVEQLNQEKTQKLLKEGNDKLSALTFSPDMKILIAWSQYGDMDSFPTIYFWDAITFKKTNQIAINDSKLNLVEFSPRSNMLLVVSQSQGQLSSSNIAIWDFLDGNRDIFCKSVLPHEVVDGKWNHSADHDEFVLLGTKQFWFYRISATLQLQYQEGRMPPRDKNTLDESSKLTCIEFVFPHHLAFSVYMLVGASNGYVWVYDARTNQFMYQVKVLESTSVKKIHSFSTKTVIESDQDAILRCWQPKEDSSDGDIYNLFMATESTLTLDGSVVGIHHDEVGNEAILSTTAGTIWFASWPEQATLKLKSTHCPTSEINCFEFKYLPPGQFQVQDTVDQYYTFDQNYQIASSGKDGIIKLWNLFDFEFNLQFIVPKEECVSVAMHQFKPYMLASYTDGFVRFFDLSKSTNLGRCRTTPQSEETSGPQDYTVVMHILPSGNHVICATLNGLIYLISVQQWDPLGIKIETLCHINSRVYTFAISFLEPYNKWMVGTGNGKVIVYNRKDCNSFQQQIFDEDHPAKYIFMDSFNALDYVNNNFTESKRTNTLDHYYSTAKREYEPNLVQDENNCSCLFANNDLTLSISFIKKCPVIFFRNFELHQVVKKVNLDYLPISMEQAINSNFIFLLLSDASLKMIDTINPVNTTEIKTIHEEAKIMRVCPNGKYILTGGNKGDIAIWNVKKLGIVSSEGL